MPKAIVISKQKLKAQIIKHNGFKSTIAKDLDISRNTLNKELDRLGLNDYCIEYKNREKGVLVKNAWDRLGELLVQSEDWRLPAWIIEKLSDLTESHNITKEQVKPVHLIIEQKIMDSDNE